MSFSENIRKHFGRVDAFVRNHAEICRGFLHSILNHRSVLFQCVKSTFGRLFQTRKFCVFAGGLFIFMWGGPLKPRNMMGEMTWISLFLAVLSIALLLL